MRAIERILICALLVWLPSAALTESTASADWNITQIGADHRELLDITPDGRFALIGSYREGTWFRVRVDLRTRVTVRVPFGDRLTANGRSVIGVHNGQLKRFNIPNRTRRTLPRPASHWNELTVSSISDSGTRIGLHAYSHARDMDAVFIVNTNRGTVKRLDNRIPWRGNGGSAGGLSLSADGTIATFTMAPTLYGHSDVLIYRARPNTVHAITRDINGNRTTGDSYAQSISGDGRYVLFTSDAPRLVPRTPQRVPRYFIRDRRTNETRRVFIPVSQYTWPAAQLNHNGSRIAFVLDGDLTGQRHGPLVGYRNRDTGTTTQLMRAVDGGPPDGTFIPTRGRLVIDAYGVTVGFTSNATNLTAHGPGHWAVRSYVARP